MTRLPSKIRKLPTFGRMGITKAQKSILDSLWSQAVKARAGQRCEVTLRKGIRLESHHFYGRRNLSVRWVVSNGFSLGHDKHRWAEEQPAEFMAWAINSRGQRWFEDLQMQSRMLKTFKEYRLIKAYLESFL